MTRGALLAALILLTACAAPGGVGAPAPTASPTAAPAEASPSTPAPSASPTRRVLAKGHLEKLSLHSNALNRTMQYLIYFPPGYDQNPKGRYATAFVLHGGGGDLYEWVSYGLIDAAERLMQNGEVRPFLIVMPEGDQEYWVDHVIDKTTGANGEKWGTYVAKDVVPQIDQKHRTVASAQARAIGGLSMGGHGAMQLGMNFPGIWSAIAATSPSLRPETNRDPRLRSESDAPTYLGFGAEFAARDPLSLITAKPDVALQYTWWLDTGRLDPWVRPARAVHEQLDTLGVAHHWDTPPGGHEAAYWSAHVEDYIRFYASALCRDPSACPYPP